MNVAVAPAQLESLASSNTQQKHAVARTQKRMSRNELYPRDHPFDSVTSVSPTPPSAMNPASWCAPSLLSPRLSRVEHVSTSIPIRDASHGWEWPTPWIRQVNHPRALYTTPHMFLDLPRALLDWAHPIRRRHACEFDSSFRSAVRCAGVILVQHMSMNKT